jgi:hypothetical protein
MVVGVLRGELSIWRYYPLWNLAMPLKYVEADFEDIQEIDHKFPFDVLFCDAAFMAARLVRQVLGKHVCGAGAVVEDRIRTVKQAGLGRFPSREFAINAV